jgi:hypothetical protein
MAGTKAGAAKRRAVRTTPSAEVVRAALPPAAQYEVGRRPLLHDGLLLQPGDPVPGAENWPRVESWERSGRIVKR